MLCLNRVSVLMNYYVFIDYIGFNFFVMVIIYLCILSCVSRPSLLCFIQPMAAYFIHAADWLLKPEGAKKV